MELYHHVIINVVSKGKKKRVLRATTLSLPSWLAGRLGSFGKIYILWPADCVKGVTVCELPPDE